MRIFIIEINEILLSVNIKYSNVFLLESIFILCILVCD